MEQAIGSGKPFLLDANNKAEMNPAGEASGGSPARAASSLPSAANPDPRNRFTVKTASCLRRDRQGRQRLKAGPLSQEHSTVRRRQELAGFLKREDPWRSWRHGDSRFSPWG